MDDRRPSLPSRRDVLKGMLAAGALGFLPRCADDVGARRPRVAIVGGGMSGIATAWLLDGAWDVVVYESASAIGGNVRTFTGELGGTSLTIDMGAQYFAPSLYPTYTRLIDRLGLADSVWEFPATITILGAGEANPRFLSPVGPDRLWPAGEAWNTQGLATFITLAAESPKLESDDAPYDLTVDAWLRSLSLDETQRETIALPWIASIGSGDIEQTRTMSARATLVYLGKTADDDPFAVVHYRTLPSGMIEALRRMLAECTTVTVETSSAVEAVSARSGGGFRVRASGRTQSFDALVLAIPAEPAAALVDALPGREALAGALRGVAFHDVDVTLHTDPLYVAADRTQWSFVNALASGGYAENSMWLGAALRPLAPDTTVDWWKSWVTHRTTQPQAILASERYRHVLPSPASLASAASVRALSGTDDLWIAGGWTFPYDIQDTALQSALAVAAGLSPESVRAAALRA